jgi:hypothetical protein
MFGKNKIISLWFLFLVITFFMSILVVNPTMNPDNSAINYAQLQLQFAYSAENGINVLESWGGDAKSRYLSVIWIDVLFALSYGPFFFLLLRRFNVRGPASYIPLLEMLTNLTETSMEIFWMVNHSPSELYNGLYLTHSIIATIKWSLVPIYLIHSLYVINKALEPSARNINGPENLA